MKKEDYGFLSEKQKKLNEMITFDEISNQIIIQEKNNKPFRFKYALVLVMVFSFLLVAAGIGITINKIEMTEYQHAIEFLEDNELSTKNLTKSEIKEVYKDITTKNFKFRKTAEIIEISIKEKVPSYELENYDSNKINEAWELWLDIRKGEYYSVSFIDNGGTLISGELNQVVYYIGEIKYPVFEKKGYVIKDYNILEDKENKIITIEVIWERNKDLYLFEIYLENELYFANYYLSGEEINVTLPSKDHYTLNIETEIPKLMPQNDVKINLSWVKNKYKLTIFYESDQIGVREFIFDYGSIIPEPNLAQFEEFSKRGYDFGYWDKEFPFVLEGDTEINAVWIPHQYHLIFDSLGAQYLEFDEMYVDFGEEFTLPKVTKNGFVFEGWYYYTEKFNSGTWNRFYYTKSLTLTAKWSYADEHYYFGRYPQSHVADTELINNLNKLTTTNQYGYYEYNGEQYLKINAAPVVENVLYYSSGSVVVKKEEWFKVEPIKWYISGKNTYTLSPVNVLDITYYDLENNPYSTSNLRRFLNNNFLYQAFTKDEINLIIKSSRVITEVRVTGTSSAITGIGISDYVMAKSITSSFKNLELTDYAIARGACVTASTNNTTNVTRYFGWWWVIEQYELSNTVYYNTYYNPTDDEFKYKKGTAHGIGINFSILLKNV